MSPELSHPSAPVLWRGKNPGMPEFSALFGMLPASALLVDRGRETVVLANPLFSRMCNYSIAELSGALVTDLLPGLGVTKLADGDEIDLTLKRHKLDGLDVHVRVRMLDSNGSWLVLQIEPDNKQQMSDARIRELFQRYLQSLIQLVDEADIDRALARGVEIITTFFDTDLACIYLAEGEFPRLARMASSEGGKIFPDIISSTDLIRLSKTTLWTPGKRVQAEVHRFGRISNLSYVLTTPIGPASALSGMLVIASTNSVPNELTNGMAEISAALLGLVLQYFVLNGNLQQEIAKHERLNTTHLAAFENSEEGIILLAPDLTIRELNPTAEWMLGYATWETQGQPVNNILIGPDRLMPALESATQGIPTHNIGNVSLHRRTGQSFPAHLQAIPVQQDNEILGVIVFLTDVSIREQNRQRTQQLEHRAILGDVTAVFAHEVRNPINNISTGLQLMSGRMQPGDPNLETIIRIEADCTRLNHLMESVLAFSRPTEYKLEPVDAGGLLQRLLDRWRPRLSRINVESFFQCAEGTPRILADPRALEQIFTNLISNATEAMNKTGGTLAIRIARSQNTSPRPQVEISVSDNGPGIPDELRVHIFEPFVTNKAGGTGLGLAITKRILTAHHGSITVDSFPGGTVFHVFLPAYQET